MNNTTFLVVVGVGALLWFKQLENERKQSKMESLALRDRLWDEGDDWFDEWEESTVVPEDEDLDWEQLWKDIGV